MTRIHEHSTRKIEINNKLINELTDERTDGGTD